MQRFYILILSSLTLMPVVALADYCASNGGVRQCGFATLESCLQTISGVGGMCTPNAGSPPPNLLQRLREQQQQQQQQQQQYQNPAQLPGINWMPPPPSE